MHLKRPSSIAIVPLQNSTSAGHSDPHKYFPINNCATTTIIHCKVAPLSFVQPPPSHHNNHHNNHHQNHTTINTTTTKTITTTKTTTTTTPLLSTPPSSPPVGCTFRPFGPFWDQFKSKTRLLTVLYCVSVFFLLVVFFEPIHG